MSVVLDVADAVVDSLVGGTFSQSFTPERRYAPVFDASKGELNTLRVSVIPVGVEFSAADRHSDFTRVQVSIVVEKKVDKSDQTEADEMMVLVEEIRDHLKRNALPSAPDAKWLSHPIDQLFNAEQLTSTSVFSSVQTVTYQV